MRELMDEKQKRNVETKNKKKGQENKRRKEGKEEEEEEVKSNESLKGRPRR
jgi:hypothetical protein